ncbi:MAG TPA: spermidine synthase, partial [Alphaproteobacteria bacterium]|nr:spermidine synthase [Alphaproteobacteria bacterium]
MNKTQSLAFTLTVFLSAYLLFVVQPIVGKAILPVLGGTPMVWNTTMMFFQILLLGGYFYAHTLSKIGSLKIQSALHAGLILAAGLITLPMATTMNPPADTQSPLIWQLGEMILMIGLPFLFLSASAPLLQKWFSQTTHPDAHNPYFLYSASNIGSVLALILYPVLAERVLPLPEQSVFWAAGYAGLWLLMVGCSVLAISRLGRHQVEEDIFNDADNAAPDKKTIALWLLLSFVPSSLMLGYTSFITTDIGSLPLFWVIPLALYILSFVIAFSKRTLLPLPVTRTVYAILTTILFAMMGSIYYLKLELGLALGVLFFVTAIMCHQELVRLKPTTHHLTLFYLVMSCGGALGGIFNALIAPLIFVKPYELMIVLGLSLFCWNLPAKLSLSSQPNQKTALLILATTLTIGIASFLILRYAFGSNLQLLLPLIGIMSILLILGVMDRRPYFIAACLVFLLATPIIPWSGKNKIVDISRNYFGTLTTTDNDLTRNLSHGITLHGSQPLDPKYKTIPLTYYNPKTAIGQTFSIVEKSHDSIKTAGLGLGTGSVSCLLRPDDQITFYEIDPDIIRIASNPEIYSYLHDCPPKSGIVQGDARLKIQNAPDHSYDLVLVDVFSSDSIPMHLITKEA